MQKRIALLLLFVIVVAGQKARAQNIEGGAIMGINGSQLDGDNMDGYHKIGLNVGVKAKIPFSDQVSGTMEMLYSQKGSRLQLNFDSKNYQPLTTYVFDYVDVPIIVNYHTNKKVFFGGGLSAGYLVRFKRVNNGFVQPRDPSVFEYRTYDINFIANIGYPINEHWVANGRFSYSANIGPNQFHNFFSVRMIYMF